MVLGKLPVPGRPTILITVGQGPIALAVGAGGLVWTFLLSSILSSLSPSLWETAQYRLKYCFKGPLNPKQPTNQYFWTVTRSCGSMCFAPDLLIGLRENSLQPKGGLQEIRIVKRLSAKGM